MRGKSSRRMPRPRRKSPIAWATATSPTSSTPSARATARRHGDSSAAPLPGEPHADIDCMVVGAAADAAVVAQVDLGRRGDVGLGLEADHGGIARRRGAEHGEGIARRAGEGRGDRPAGVGELVLPAQPDRDVELALVAETDRASEIGADGGALRVRRLLRDVEAERLCATFAERVLRHARNLEVAERRDGRGSGSIDAHLASALDLAEELVGAGRAGGGALLQAGDQDLALQLVAVIGVARESVDVEA